MERIDRRTCIAAVLVLLSGSIAASPKAVAVSVDDYQLSPRIIVQPSWPAALAPGSTAISGSGASASYLDVKLGHLVRLDQELRVRESVPLPTPVTDRLRQRSGSILHLAPFPGGSWLLDPEQGEIRRYSGGEWHGPFRPGVGFSAGAARSAEEVLLNTPQEAQPFALYRPSDGRLRLFGVPEEAPHPQLRGEYNSWVLGASPGGWIAAHRFLPRLASFEDDGRLRWKKTVSTEAVDRLAREHEREISKAAAEASACCISVELVHLAESLQVRDDGSMLINYSASPRLVEVDPQGRVVREIALRGEGVAGLDRFGFASVGGQVVAPFQGAVRIFEPAGARLQGKVIDDEGEPVAGATVTLTTPSSMRSGETDESGLFWLSRSAEAGALRVMSEGFLPLEVRGSAAEILKHDIVLERQPEICLRVVDADTGEPVARYQVSIARHRESSSSVSTTDGSTRDIEDEDGRTCLRPPFQPPLLLVVAAEGYSRWDQRLAAIGDFDVELGPEARVAVAIRSPGGAPIAGAEALLVEPEVIARSAWAESFGARSDAEGELLLRGVAPGRWVLVVRHRDHLEERRLLELEAETNEIEVVLSAGSRALVRVARAGGEPVPGATVMLVPAASVRAPMRECVTDGEGSCSVAKLERGRYRLAVEWRSGTIASRAVVVTAANEVFEVEVDRGVEVWGRLLGIESYGDASFTVAARTEAGGQVSAAADAAGRFLLDGIEPESWAQVVVRASAAGSAAPWSVLTTAVHLPRAGETFDLELPESVAISGRVSEGGRPCAWCDLMLRTEHGSSSANVRATTSPDGDYRALLPAPGTYLAVVDGSRGPSHRALDVTGSGRYDIELDDASIRGRVVLATDGSGAAHAAVVLRRSDGLTVGTTFSGSDGDFAFSGLSEGGYRVAAHHAEGVADRRVSVTASSREEVTLELEAREALRLRLLDAETGAAVVRSALKLYDANGGLVFERRFAAAGGDIDVPIAGRGPFTAVVSAYGFGLATLFDLSPGESERVVALRRASTLVVMPARGADVFALLDPRGRPIAVSFDRPPGFVSLAPGPMMFPDIAAGRHVVAGGDGRQSVELTAGRQTLVEL